MSTQIHKTAKQLQIKLYASYFILNAEYKEYEISKNVSKIWHHGLTEQSKLNLMGQLVLKRTSHDLYNFRLN